MKPTHLLVVLGIAGLAFGAGMRLGSADRPRAVYGEDAAERLTALLRMQEPNPRAIALAEFFAQANPVDLEGLAEVLKDERQHVDEVAEVLFADWWARFDPAGALEGRRPPPWGGRHPWVRTVVRHWAQQQPGAAVAAVVALPDSRWVGRQAAVRALIHGWMEANHTETAPLVQLLAGVEGVRNRGEAIDILMREIIETRGLDAAERLVDQLPVGTANIATEVHGRLVSAMLSRDPERAVAFANQHASGPHGSGLLLHMAANWGWKDGASALAWATSLPEGPHKEKAVERAGRSFLSKGEEAEAWFAAQEPTRALEPAYALYLRHIAKTGKPREALEGLAHISVPERRTKVLTVVLRAWLDQDPTQAQAWIEQAKLPEGLVSELHKQPSRRASPNRRGSDPSSSARRVDG